MSGGARPLAGVRVLDLSRLLPGPMCSAHLGAMGADVIKVEDPGGGDYARAMGSFFETLNRGKRSVALDLKTAAGQAGFMALAATANVVLEGFRPGVVRSLGVDFERVRAVRPDIVYCSLSGYGQTGPYRGVAGHDINYLALTGVLHETAAGDGGPGLCNLQIADLLGGALSAAMAILAALYQARVSGTGRYLDVAMSDCVLAHNVMPLMAHNDHGASAPRGADFLTGGLPWYNVYATQDGRHVALGALEAKFWRRFCDEVGWHDWREQPGDAATQRQIARALTELFVTRTLEHWVARFAGVDCCLSPVLTLEESMRDPQIGARGMVVQRDGRRDYAFPIRFEPPLNTDSMAPAPALGAHTRELLDEVGYRPAP